jgi:heterodisulfide reductase subunit B
MKNYAFFIGCNIPARVQQYEMAARAVLSRVDVGLKDFRDFNCCGYPMRNTDETSYLLSAAKNLALAEKAGMDILTLCKCCFGSLKIAAHRLNEDEKLQNEINKELDSHGLTFKGNIDIKHFLSVLHQEVGIDALKEKITTPYEKLNIATHYGCHALRPSEITQFDDPVAPTLFDELVSVTRAKSVDWQTRLECCGAPLTGINDDLSRNLTKKKIKDGKSAGAHYLCVACPWCHIQFDSVQAEMMSDNGNKPSLAPILYPQLLGLSMGIGAEELGIEMNCMDINGITSYLSSEEKDSAEE